MRSQGPQEGRWPRGGPMGPAQPSLSPHRPLDALSAWAGPPPPPPATQEAGSSSWSVPSVALLGKTSRVLRLLFPGSGGWCLSGVSAPTTSSMVPCRPPCSLPPGSVHPPPHLPAQAHLLPQLPSFPPAPSPSHRRPLPNLLGLGDVSEPPPPGSLPWPLRALGPAGVTLGSTLCPPPVGHARCPRGRASLSIWGRAPTEAALTDPSTFGLTGMLDSSRKQSFCGPPSRRTGFPRTSGGGRPTRPPRTLT